MPNQKISELTAVTSPSVNDVLPIVNEGATKKITIPNLVNNTLSGTMLSVSAVQLPGNFLMKSVSANNLFLGNNATGNNNLRNSNNFVFGINSANSLSASKSNVVMGADSTKNAVFLNNNIFLGDASGGSMGFCFGSNHFPNISLPASIESNIVMGTRAGFKLSQASFCDRITNYGPCGTYYTYDYKCGTSRNNIFLGDHSGHTASYSCCNIMIGASAGRLLINGSSNIFIGTQAGGRNNKCNNVFIGLSAGICAYAGKAIAIGLGAGRCAGDSINIGYKANYFGCRSGINIGCFAGFCDLGYENINIGNNAGCRRGPGGSGNISIGRGTGTGCGCQNCSNVIIGDRAGGHCTNNSKFNVLIGDRIGGSLGYATNAFVGCHNIAIGAYGGSCLHNNNIAIGTGTGAGRNLLRDAIAIGRGTLSILLSSTGACNSIAIGYHAGYSHGGGNTNMFIGRKAGCNYTPSFNPIEGSYNIFLGMCAGACKTSNCLNGNIMIGNCAFASSAFPLSATIAIGNLVRPNQSNQLAMGSSTFPLGTSTTAGASAGFLNVLLNGTVRKVMFFAD